MSVRYGVDLNSAVVAYRPAAGEERPVSAKNVCKELAKCTAAGMVNTHGQAWNNRPVVAYCALVRGASGGQFFDRKGCCGFVGLPDQRDRTAWRVGYIRRRTAVD